jgi:excisionase family DNA binding protein
VKKTAQIDSSDDSYSVGEVASLLGVSIPTVKRMAQAGTLETFRTPGGHLRVLAGSVEAIKQQRRSLVRPAHGPSPVLQNRRERLEEVTLETQELRAKRDLERLRREDRDEAERREAEVQAHEEEAEQRRAEIALERERLERERAEDCRRRQREQAEEQDRLVAEKQLAAFRERWYSVAGEAVARMPRLNWLTAGQRKEVAESLELEIDRRQPADEPRMNEIIARTLLALVEPLQAERDAQERRQRLADEALRTLPYSATDADKVNATSAIREALRPFDRFADVCETRVAVHNAILPVRQAVQKRELDNRLLQGAVWRLPWGKSDEDVARVRRECAEILADLATDTSEAKARGALEPTIQEACREIEERKAKADRLSRKAGLIQQGIAEVVSYMVELQRRGELTLEEYYDPELTDHWRTIVRRGLESDLTGEESTKEVRQLARGIINEELE